MTCCSSAIRTISACCPAIRGLRAGDEHHATAHLPAPADLEEGIGWLMRVHYGHLQTPLCSLASLARCARMCRNRRGPGVRRHLRRAPMRHRGTTRLRCQRIPTCTRIALTRSHPATLPGATVLQVTTVPGAQVRRAASTGRWNKRRKDRGRSGTTLEQRVRSATRARRGGQCSRYCSQAIALAA